jgi:hypothetical protein
MFMGASAGLQYEYGVSEGQHLKIFRAKKDMGFIDVERGVIEMTRETRLSI